MSAAYSAVTKDLLPDATAQGNIRQRTGGALGSAQFVVILENHARSVEASFHTTFFWLTITTAVALAAALWLTAEQLHNPGPGGGKNQGAAHGVNVGPPS